MTKCLKIIEIEMQAAFANSILYQNFKNAIYLIYCETVTDGQKDAIIHRQRRVYKLIILRITNIKQLELPEMPNHV